MGKRDGSDSVAADRRLSGLLDGGCDQINDCGGVLVCVDDLLVAAGQDIVLAPPLPKQSLPEFSTALAVMASDRFFERQIKQKNLVVPR